ncbi:MAG: dihydropyrimidinase, partial [Terriglobales bacterium]
MGFDLVIANGLVVTATDTFAADVGVTGGKIAALGQALPRENAGRVLDAAGRYILPGGIDVHTHLDMP